MFLGVQGLNLLNIINGVKYLLTQAIIVGRRCTNILDVRVFVVLPAKQG